MKKKTGDILKKINKKIDGVTQNQELAEDLKSEIKELASMSDSEEITEQLDMINSKLETLESNNMSLKDSVYDFVTSSVKTLETLTKTEQPDDNKVDELSNFIKTLDKKIDKIIKKNDDIDYSSGNFGDDNQFKKLKTELTFFQNEIENRINENSADLNETVTSIISDLKNKISDIQEMYEQNTEKLLTTVISDVKQLKSDFGDLSNSIGSIDNQAIFETEKNVKKLIEQNEKSTQTLLFELGDIKSSTAKSSALDEKNKETVETFKQELNLLKTNIHSQIREVLSRLLVQDEIKFLCEESITGIKNNGSETGVVRKYLKDLKSEDEHLASLISEIKNIMLELSDYEMNESSDKIDVIYENMSFLNSWADSSDKMIQKFDGINENIDNLGGYFDDLRDDFTLNSDKIDIIYENLTFINDWVKKLDEFAKNVEAIKSGYDAEAGLPEKIEEITEQIALVKEWNKKADALALQVRALSVQISETESTVNSQNLADMKKLFARMTEDMANLSSRTNKMILETDKTNDTMKDHLQNLQTIINNLDSKSGKLGISELTQKIDDIKALSTKSSGFGQGLTESFIYLAEWIDYAGNAINSIKNEIDTLHQQQQNNISITNGLSEQQSTLLNKIQELVATNVNSSQTTENENNNVVETLEDLKNRIEKNAINIDSLQSLAEGQNLQIQEIVARQAVNQQLLQEIKDNLPLVSDNQNESNSEIIENIRSLTAFIEEQESKNQSAITELLQDTSAVEKNKTDNAEIKNLLDFIAAQVVNINENNSKTDILAKKIDTVENKLSNLEQYMAKLIDYLDEE